jgi:hypothetical protein
MSDSLEHLFSSVELPSRIEVTEPHRVIVSMCQDFLDDDDQGEFHVQCVVVPVLTARRYMERVWPRDQFGVRTPECPFVYLDDVVSDSNSSALGETVSEGNEFNAKHFVTRRIAEHICRNPESLTKYWLVQTTELHPLLINGLILVDFVTLKFVSSSISVDALLDSNDSMKVKMLEASLEYKCRADICSEVSKRVEVDDFPSRVIKVDSAEEVSKCFGVPANFTPADDALVMRRFLVMKKIDDRLIKYCFDGLTRGLSAAILVATDVPDSNVD